MIAGQRLGTSQKARGSSLPTTRPLDFRFLLKSSLGCFPSAHMAKLLLADLLKFGLRFFELGFLLAKVSFSPSAPNLAGQFLPNLHWTDSTGCNGLEKPGRLDAKSGTSPSRCSQAERQLNFAWGNAGQPPPAVQSTKHIEAGSEGRETLPKGRVLPLDLICAQLTEAARCATFLVPATAEASVVSQPRKPRCLGASFEKLGCGIEQPGLPQRDSLIAAANEVTLGGVANLARRQ